MKELIIRLMALFETFGISLAQEYVVVPGGAMDGCKIYTSNHYIYQRIQEADYVQMLIEDRVVATPSKPLLELTLSKRRTRIGGSVLKIQSNQGMPGLKDVEGFYDKVAKSIKTANNKIKHKKDTK